MFAEVSQGSTAGWAAAAGVFLLVFGSVAKELRSWWKDKKDREFETVKQIREEKREVAALAIQIEQRDVLRQLEIGQTAQNGKLSKVTELNEVHYQTVIEISKTRHEEMLRVMQGNCKAQPVQIIQQNSQPKPLEKQA